VISIYVLIRLILNLWDKCLSVAKLAP